MATTSSFSPSQNIPLRRLPSSSSSKADPFADPDTESITSVETNTTAESYTTDDRSSINHSLLHHSHRDGNANGSDELARAWQPTAIFRIKSKGKPFLAPPTPVSELEIPISRIIVSGDGEIQGEESAFVSMRPERRSGSCDLFAESAAGLGERLAGTKYVWGPGRNPVVRVLPPLELRMIVGIKADEFEIKKSSIWNRTCAFRSQRCGGADFEWRYAGKPERKVVAGLRARASGKAAEEINSLLVLERILGGKGKGEKRIRVAMLIRGDETRTEGSGKKDAGNGGVLEVCFNGGGEEGDVIDEVTVVVTCLVMLKKEVDRARGRKIAAMGAIAGGAM